MILFSFIQGALQYYFAFFPSYRWGSASVGFVPSITAVNAWMVREPSDCDVVCDWWKQHCGACWCRPMVWSINTYGWRPTVFVIGMSSRWRAGSVRCEASW